MHIIQLQLSRARAITLLRALTRQQHPGERIVDLANVVSSPPSPPMRERETYAVRRTPHPPPSPVRKQASKQARIKQFDGRGAAVENAGYVRVCVCVLFGAGGVEVSTPRPRLPLRRPVGIVSEGFGLGRVLVGGVPERRRPSPPHTASCPRRPWPRTAPSACRSGPSTSRRASCRPRLDTRISMHITTRELCNIPNLMPGLSSRTLSRVSLAKNM